LEFYDDQENRKLRSMHAAFGEQVCGLMDISLLRQQPKWKEKIEVVAVVVVLGDLPRVFKVEGEDRGAPSLLLWPLQDRDGVEKMQPTSAIYLGDLSRRFTGHARERRQDAAELP